MFKIHSLGSSSEGNAFLVTDGISTIVIDAGFNIKDMQSWLFDLGYAKVDGVLISHAHKDHALGVNFSKLSKKFMTKDTFKELTRTGIQLEKSELEIIEVEKTYKIGSFTIKAYPTIHDSNGSVCFLVKNASGEKLIYYTDTGIFNYNLVDADVYIIEANHSEVDLKRKLDAGLIEQPRYDRISQNHASVEKSISYLKKNVGPSTKQVILMHMSPTNANPVNFQNWVRKEINESYVNFIHPVRNKKSNFFEVGYKATRQANF